MRLVSKLPGPSLWLLLFMILCELRCHASFSGSEVDQSHDEEQGSIQVGKGVREGVDEDPLHGGADQDGEYEDPLHGGADQDGEYEGPLHGGADQDGEYEDPLHGRLKPRSLFNAPEGDNVHSSRADFPCPQAADIEPCLCTVDAAQNIDLDCTHVSSEEQLAAVFQQEFPVKTLRYFNMTENSNIKLLDNILNGVSFQKINLYPGPFALSAISDYFFLDCRESLDYVAIINSDLTSASFPFATLAVMAKLKSIEVRGSDFTWIPSIIAPSVSALRLTYGKTEIVQAGTFPIREGPILIYLYNNLLHTVEPGSFYFRDENSMASNEEVKIDLSSNMLRYVQAGTFPIRNGPTYISLYDNQIEVMEPGTFVLPGDTSMASNEEVIIDLSSNMLRYVQAGTFPIRNGPTLISLDDNQIEVMEPGTFVLPGDTTQLSLELYLYNNQLTAYPEEVFDELMPYTTYVGLNGNPLICDCALAWIITSPEYLAKIDSQTTCGDGTYLHDLNPDDYINFC